MPSFKTPTEPELAVATESEVRRENTLDVTYHRLTITGAVVKVLVDWTTDKKAVDDEYKYVDDHYKARKAERDTGTTKREKDEAERVGDPEDHPQFVLKGLR